MDCNEVERMQLIEGYLDESLSPEQMEALEKHYLECGNCFSTLQLQHAIRLEAKPTDRHVGRSPEPESLQGWIATSRRWLLPLAALIVLLVVPLSLLIDRDSGPGGSNLPARLIEIESIPAYVETTVRGGQAGDSLASFRAGMEAYRREDYGAAVTGLEQAQAANPDHLPTAFYLGLSYLLQDNSTAAAERLLKVVSVGKTPYSEEARWYLAKAYFRLGQVEAGREQLEAVRAMGKAYQQDAEQNLALLDTGRN